MSLRGSEFKEKLEVSRLPSEVSLKILISQEKANEAIANLLKLIKKAAQAESQLDVAANDVAKLLLDKLQLAITIQFLCNTMKLSNAGRPNKKL